MACCALLCCAAQAAADGSLPVLVQKLRSQPQILTAYARDAPMRQPATADNLVTALQELQVRNRMEGRPASHLWLGPLPSAP